MQLIGRVLLLLMWLVATLAPGQAAFGEAASLVIDGVSGCRFRLGRALPGSSGQWMGPCRDWLAEGVGVLRVYARRNGSAVITATFYGEMLAGSISFGVVDTGEGFLAGRFKDGEYQDSDDFNTRQAAFRMASGAAQAASALFAKQGNTNSAGYYRRMATQLDMQIE